MIRKAIPSDLDGIEELYDAIFRREEQTGQCDTSWRRGVYPLREDAREAGKAGTLYVDIQGGDVASCAVFDQIQPAEYANAAWTVPAKRGEVLVVHTLAVHPVITRHGLGRNLMAFAEGLAAGMGCKAVRLDTYEGNLPARKFYEKLGYQEAGRVSFQFAFGTTQMQVCFEKALG